MGSELVRLATWLQREHDLATRHAESALHHARQAGELLLQAKALVGHGAWEGWLSANFPGSARTARRYMRLSKRWDELPDSKTATLADLTLTAADATLATKRTGAEIELLNSLTMSDVLLATFTKTGYRPEGTGATAAILAYVFPLDEAGAYFHVGQDVIIIEHPRGWAEGTRRGIARYAVPNTLWILDLPPLTSDAWLKSPDRHWGEEHRAMVRDAPRRPFRQDPRL